VLDAGDDAVLVWRRQHPRHGTVVGLANVAAGPRAVDADTVTGFGTLAFVHGSDGPLGVEDGRVVVPALGFAWFAEP
jgi:amylosucrase